MKRKTLPKRRADGTFAPKRLSKPARRRNPDTVFGAGDEQFIVSEAKRLIRASKRLTNKGTSPSVVFGTGPAWVLQTERIGDVVYAVVKRGREIHYFTVMDLNDRPKKSPLKNPSNRRPAQRKR